ncbi:MAG: hypothetical protein EON58_23205 [Alphaproteobacteria bacterium]|nr:MAG: hypothetical protein EON58_23205 [Alphaproteobacteria bacterium]
MENTKSITETGVGSAAASSRVLHFTDQELHAIYVAFGMTVDCETEAGQLAVFGSPSKVRVAKATYEKVTRFLNVNFRDKR